MTPAAVILAAGEGARLGGVAKALLPAGEGTSFLAAIVRTARAVGLGDAVVVVGPPHGPRVAEHARALGLRVAENPAPARGMASSVAIGFAALGEGEVAWLWPVDHPHVRAATLAALVAAAERAPDRVLQPRHAGRGGHPPLVPRALWAELAASAERAGGAREVLGPRMLGLDVDDPGVVRDVDEPADLEAAR